MMFVCRVKAYMSDGGWSGVPLLYLPAELCQKIAASGAVPTGLTKDVNGSVVFFHAVAADA